MAADVIRGLAIILGGAVITVAMLDAVVNLTCWRQDTRCKWLALRSFASALGVALLVAELGERIGEPLTYRTPLSACVFAAVLVAIVGAARAKR